MKKYILISLLAVLVLAGCESLAEIGRSMAASNFDNYVKDNGAPTSSYKLADGNTLYSFMKPCPNSQSFEQTNVLVNGSNTIVQITKKQSCPASN